MIYVPPPFAADSILEAIDAEMEVIMLHHRRYPGAGHDEGQARAGRPPNPSLIGPNCPGVITPDACKIGIMPGHIHKRGSCGVVSRSGTLTYEAVKQTTDCGSLASPPASASAATRSRAPNISTCWNGSLPMTRPRVIIMIGEIGGSAEEEAAQFLADEKQERPLETHRRFHRRPHRASGPPHGPCRCDCRRWQGRRRRARSKQ